MVEFLAFVNRLLPLTTIKSTRCYVKLSSLSFSQRAQLTCQRRHDLRTAHWVWKSIRQELQSEMAKTSRSDNTNSVKDSSILLETFAQIKATLLVPIVDKDDIIVPEILCQGHALSNLEEKRKKKKNN